jgi:phenylalanyl-tRNA synthetase alpha chain
MIAFRLGRAYSTIRKQIAAQWDHTTNITESILSKVDRKLLTTPNHPLQILSKKIDDYMLSRFQYNIIKNLSPIVTVHQNFDLLGTPIDHPSRARTDTYYLNERQVLRCHTSAHQLEVMQSGGSAFLVYGDVYRRDEIDQTHYPIFHQMEGIRLFDDSQLQSLKIEYGQVPKDELLIGPDNKPQNVHDISKVHLVARHLKQELEGLMVALFGNVEMRWLETYFPFTAPRLQILIAVGNLKFFMKVDGWKYWAVE